MSDKHDENKMNPNDHKVLGKKLGLFTFSDTVGQGLPMWTAKGSVIRRELERFIVDEEVKRGYEHVYTPDVAKLELYEKSGHYPYYKDSMYAPIDIDGDKFMLRPMTCPHHFELYLSHPHSYRELPIRIAELAKLYRYEQSGELMGLLRVRSFCLSDAHIIALPEQTGEEIDKVLDLIEHVVGILGLSYYDEKNKQGDYFYRLSLGDRKNAKKYYKDDEAWDKSENILREALKRRNLDFKEVEDEAAFYGPKIDIQMRNANGKEDTAITVQYDFVMPKRFDLTYVDEDGKEKEPIVIHRSSIGAIERTIAFLIEKYEGAFPVWLSPVQVKILPVTDRNLDYAGEILKKFKDESIRVEIDDRSETLGNKIRKAQEEKVPYMIVLGDREVESESLSLRLRSGENKNNIKLEEFVGEIKEKIENKSLEL
jgi:threonyl-tRNA synthetase